MFPPKDLLILVLTEKVSCTLIHISKNDHAQRVYKLAAK